MPETLTPSSVARTLVNEGPARKIDFKAPLLKTRPLNSSEIISDNESNFGNILEINSKRSRLDPRRLIPERLKRRKDRVEDEYKNSADPELKPLPIDPTYPEFARQTLPDQLQDIFDYYSRTRNVEFDSPGHPSERARFIQENIVDKMTKGTGIKTRVVIMNKGSDAAAFVVPDGTIFISQSLINQLDTLDEVAGVLAHELGHLINKSSLKIHNSRDYFGQDTVKGWVQENLCDIQAPDLLQTAGFNSMGFGRAIEKISSNSRGAIHMGGLFRGVVSAARHFVKHSTTSTTKTTEIPAFLKGNVEKTNLEIAESSVNEYRTLTGISLEGAYRKRLKSQLENLHPKDFKNLYFSKIRNNYDEQMVEKTRIFEEIITERLLQAGHSKDEARLFLLLNKKIEFYTNRPEYVYQFNSLEDLPKTVDIVEKFDANPEIAKSMYKLVFMAGTERLSMAHIFETPPSITFLGHLAEYLHESDEKMEKHGIPVTRETLLSALDRIKDIPTNTNYRELSLLRSYTQKAIENYIKNSYLHFASQAQTELDTDQLKSFLEEVRSRGIYIDGKKLEAAIMPNINTPEDLRSNRTLAQLAVKEFFGLEDWKPTEKNINSFFSEYLTSPNQRDGLFDFINSLENYFTENRVEDNEKVKVMDMIAAQIKQNSFDSDYGITTLIKTGVSKSKYQVSPEDMELNEKIIKSSLLSVFALRLYSQDGDEFYKHINESMSYLSEDINSLSPVAMINLSRNILNTADSETGLRTFGAREVLDQSWGSKVQISNFDRLLQLPFLQKAKLVTQNVEASNFGELNEYIEELDFKIRFVSNTPNLFNDTLVNLFVGEGIRGKFCEILAQKQFDGLNQVDYDGMHNFVNRYYPEGVQRDQLLKTISELYLKSEDPSITLEGKIGYLLGHFDEIGIEGMVIVAEQINNITDYRNFKDKLKEKFPEYEDGKGAMKKIYAAEIISSMGAQKYETLVKSARSDPEAIKESSDSLVKSWFSSIFEPNQRAVSMLDYDSAANRFQMNELGRKFFRSVTDVVDTLRNMNQYERFVLALKAMTDPNGAFSSDSQKKEFGKSLVEAVGLGEKKFLKAVVETGVERGDPLVIGIPIASMLSPLLFRSYDLSTVDYDVVSEHLIRSYQDDGEFQLGEIIDPQFLPGIVNSSTRDLTLFGAKYNNGKSTEALALAAESDKLYLHSLEQMQSVLGMNNSRAEVSGSTDGELDPAIEAAVRAAETSPIGKRGMQIAYQFTKFEPAVGRRLSQSLDSNPGMNKLDFWDELDDESARAMAAGDPGVEAFLQRIILDGMLGGGSLQTTRAATYLEGDGSQRDVVLKMESPNAAWQVETGASIARNVLTHIARTHRGSVRRNANVALSIVDFASNWCLKDLNDQNFEKDDDAYRGIVERFNSLNNSDYFYVPERIFTRQRIKSEDQASGDTINRTFRASEGTAITKDESVDGILENPQIAPAKKKEVVEQLSKIFKFQLRKDNLVDTNEGKRVLVHSDPHMGNFVVDMDGDKPKIGIIDRSLYLRLEEADLPVFEKLIYSDSPTDFAEAFINRVMDVNKVRGVQRMVAGNRVWATLGLESAKQMARGEKDKSALLNTMLNEFSSMNMDIKLDFRLMIRNVAAMQELASGYGIDFRKV